MSFCNNIMFYSLFDSKSTFVSAKKKKGTNFRTF